MNSPFGNILFFSQALALVAAAELWVIGKEKPRPLAPDTMTMSIIRFLLYAI
jgi:hypothetical protein